MKKEEVIECAAQAGFGANQRNTLLVKITRLCNLVEERTLDRAQPGRAAPAPVQPATALTEAQQNDLPPFCLTTIPDAQPGSFVGAIMRGEMGYIATTYNCKTHEESTRLVERVNADLGVTPLQATCMKNGSLFGWDVPGADPAKFGPVLVAANASRLAQ